MPATRSSVYNATFYLSLAYNFLVGMNFTNNAVLPLYVKELGGTAETVGLFMGTAAISALLVRPTVGLALDRVGSKRVMLFGGVLIVLAPVGYWALLGAQQLTVWTYALRALHGFGFGAHFSGFFTLAAANSPAERRNEAIAMYGISGLLAHLIGPFLGEQILDSHGLSGFFAFLVISGVAALIAGALIPVRPEGAKAAGAVPPGPKDALRLLLSRSMRLPFTLIVLLSICFSSAQFFLAPMAKERGIADFGLYFTGYAITGVTLRFLSREWGDRYGVRRVMIPAYAMYGLSMATLYVSQSTAMLLLAGAFAGVAHSIVFPAAHSLGYNLAPPQVVGSAMALMTGMLEVGSIITAFAFGQVAEHVGYGAVFLLASAAGMTASALVGVSVLRRPEKIQSRKPAGEAAVSRVDPGGERTGRS